MDGRVEFGKSLSLAGQAVSISGSVNLIQGMTKLGDLVPNFVGNVLKNNLPRHQ